MIRFQYAITQLPNLLAVRSMSQKRPTLIAFDEIGKDINRWMCIDMDKLYQDCALISR